MVLNLIYPRHSTSATEAMKLYTVYAPPDHKDGLIHATKADAIANDLPFDGVTTEQAVS